MAATIITEQDPSAVVISVDAKNAFNAIDRAAAIDRLDATLPQLSAWVRLLYMEDPTLWRRLKSGGYATLRSSDGVQQGDPLSPLLYALASLPALKRMQAELPNAVAIAAHDDKQLFVRPADAAAAFDRFTAFMAEQGEHPNPTKCKAWSREPIPAAVADDLRSRGIKIMPPEQGVMILGVPVGSPAFVRARMLAVAKDIAADAANTLRLGDPQSVALLLRYCQATRFPFYQRCVPYELLAEAGKVVDDQLAQCAADLCGVVALPPEAAAQAQAPIRWGGLALRSAADPLLAHAAYATAFTRVLHGELDGLDLRPLLGPDFALRAAAVEAGSTADSTTYLGRGHAALKALMEGGVFQRYAQDRADIIASGRSFPAPPPPLPPDPLAAWLFPAPNSPPEAPPRALQSLLSRTVQDMRAAELEEQVAAQDPTAAACLMGTYGPATQSPVAVIPYRPALKIWPDDYTTSGFPRPGRGGGVLSGCQCRRPRHRPHERCPRALRPPPPWRRVCNCCTKQDQQACTTRAGGVRPEVYPGHLRDTRTLGGSRGRASTGAGQACRP